eukprot:5512-Heterococcus_DN1.PRE.1
MHCLLALVVLTALPVTLCDAVCVACGAWHCSVVTAEGRVLSWGFADNGYWTGLPPPPPDAPFVEPGSPQSPECNGAQCLGHCGCDCICQVSTACGHAAMLGV